MLDLVIAVFAVYRVAELIAIDEGPGDACLRLRVAVGCYDLDENGRIKTSVGRLLACPYCIGIYLALVAALIVAPHDWRVLLYWFGIAGAQAFLQTVGGRTP